MATAVTATVELLGHVNPSGTARLRRGQALRRGDHDGTTPPEGVDTGDRRIVKPRPRMRPHEAARSRPSSPACRTGRPVSEPVPRRLVRFVSDLIDASSPRRVGPHQPVNNRNRTGTLLEPLSRDDFTDRNPRSSTRHYQRRPQGRQPDISSLRAPGREPRSSCRRGRARWQRRRDLKGAGSDRGKPELRKVQRYGGRNTVANTTTHQTEDVLDGHTVPSAYATPVDVRRKLRGPPFLCESRQLRTSWHRLAAGADSPACSGDLHA